MISAVWARVYGWNGAAWARVYGWVLSLWVGLVGLVSGLSMRIFGWISSLWVRLFGWIYRRLYWYRDHYETFEPLIIFIELLLIGLGLYFEIHEAPPGTGEILMHRGHDVGEIIIFAVLGFSGLSRLAIAARGSALGYTYKKLATLVDLRGAPEIDDLYASVRQAPWGSSPAEKNDTAALSAYASAIAKHTSALLSLRTYHFRDTQWLTRDHDSLLAWFEVFPAALWRLVPTAQSGETNLLSDSDESGYYSVIVPTTAASAQQIRRGQKATDLAEVDHRMVEVFTNPPRDASGFSEVNVLAYVQLHVPRNENDRLAEELLFAASIQHVAYLLHGIYGAEEDFRATWNFVIFCEAANYRHGKVLERLGFVEMEQKAHERSEEPTGPGKSYAGFPLYELKVVSGQPSTETNKTEASKADAGKFIHLLEELVIIYWNRTKLSISASGA